MTQSSGKAKPRQALVVVGDRTIRQACVDALSNAGFAIANGVDSGAAAVTIARERHPDIIVLADQLSDVPASEAIRWLRSNQPLAATPIVIVGGSGISQQSAYDPIYALPRPVTVGAIQALLNTLANKPFQIG